MGELLLTKLHVPRRRQGLVVRSRLRERLSGGAVSALTLVSAPAGFGKTTMLTDWLAAASVDGSIPAWLSLDGRDNDPTTFWSYLVAALQTAVPGIGAGTSALLDSPRPAGEAVVAGLLNDLHVMSADVVLVLDDYHVIDAREVHDGLTFLLEHRPAGLHVVIATRADPPLPLASWRARGDLVEVRAADLRFTPDETAAYLNEVMGLALAGHDVAALEARTEGWIAALQLAALSMQGRDDVAGFIAGFAGDDRYIVDYLAEQVLQRQPADIETFLLQTSILDRLSGPLCDAVTGQKSGNATLAALERGNLFLIPLDNRRRWYRYHHLFADVLQAHLLAEQPAQVAELHRRASAWHEHEGQPTEAIRHAVAAGDLSRAADLMEPAIPAMRRTRQEATIRSWLDMLPGELVRTRPVLNIGFVGALASIGEFDGVEERLRDIERQLDATERSTDMVVVDREEFRRLPGTIELYRAALSLARGDVPATVRHAERVREVAADGDDLGRAAASGLLGLALWGGGDLEAAHQAWATCAAGLQRAGHLADIFGCAIAMADIRRTQGRLDDAMRTYEWALALAPDEGGPTLRGTADMYVGMSDIHRERNQLAAAKQQLARSQELGEHAGLPQNRYRWQVAMARVREAEGDPAGAVELLDEAQRVYTSDFFPNVRPIPALRARACLAQGELGAALSWAREQDLSVDDDLSYLREFEHVTFVRVLLARHAAELDEHDMTDATQLLARLLAAAEEGRRVDSVIEILILQALAAWARGDSRAALWALQRALALAEPEGYVRVFADEGPPMTALLKAAAKQEMARRYARRLLAAVAGSDPDIAGRQLIEPLSEREQEVLRLLATDLDGPDIARHLTVSVNTVRTHTKNIYAKLGVNNRRAAVRQAGALGLLSRAHNR